MKPILALYGIQDRFNHKYPGYTHDHNLALLVDGKIEKYIHLERYTRRKNDNRLHLYIEELIDNKTLDLPSDFDLVSVNSFVGNSFISKSGRLRIEPDTVPLVGVSPQAGTAWFQRSPWEGSSPDSWVLSHELAHIFSALPFFGELKENSLLVHFDGGASLGNFSAFHFYNNKIVKLECHWEFSHLSKIFNDNALSFALMKARPGEHCSVPGKFMGYAAMGKTTSELESWLTENNYFKDIWKDQTLFYEQAKVFGWNGNLEDNNDPFLKNVAAGLQSIFQKEILLKIEKLQEQINADYLYYTGGCALNIVTNSKLVASGLFKDVFIPPACNDAGLSLGAAAFINWYKGNRIYRHSPYLNSTKDASVNFANDTIREVAQQIANGKIIGICNGHGEAGPRALGNRSIIARPDSENIACKVSRNCKGREWFRPVAPVMLERNARRVTGLNNIPHLSKYMLLDFKIKDAEKQKMAGVVHENGMARIQTIYSRKENPFLYDLLDYLDREHNILALINTSFNKKGEPIVHTKEDAYNSYNNMKLDAFVFNGSYQNVKNELERNTIR